MTLVGASSDGIDAEVFDRIPGWLSPQARIVTRLLIDLQRKHDLVTGVLELGLYYGKFLAFLSHCVRGRDVPIVGIDAFLEHHEKRLEAAHVASAKQAMLDTISSVTGEPSSAELIAAYTSEVAPSSLLSRAPQGFSFISIDAGHDADDARCDMEFVSTLLSAGGVAAIDDVYNDTTPGVAEGFFSYFAQNPGVDIAPFATGGNKVFVCRSERHAFYYGAAESIAERAAEEYPAIKGATDRLRANRATHWSPSLLGRKIVPFPYE